MKNTIKIIVLAFLAGFGGSYTFYRLVVKPEIVSNQRDAQFNTVSYDSAEPLVSGSHTTPSSSSTTVPAAAVDFSDAAAKATQSVVYINSISQGVSYSYWDWFFGEGGGNRTQVSSGSGVIFTTDGYIVTNNHVVETAERIEVNYNKQVYPAELIGTDPSTDLAVIKIKANALPAITLGSSKTVQVGEWVIAVGNPYSLSSTVTAGIVSAKGRRIGILEDKFPIESFIQTDAAINPGNSGGALVNKNGELVGINSAILSRTGSYTGYAFAIPIDIAKKVFNDLVKYGVSQKAFFGGNVVEYDYENAKKYDLPTNVKSFNGVLLEQLDREGAAMQAGLKLGDVITKINNVDVNSQSEFEEELSYHNPGDKITFTYYRDGKPNTVTLTLVNQNGTTEIIKRKILTDASLGAQLEGTRYGVKVFKIKDNSIFRQIGLPENFTIVAINRQRVKEPEEISEFFTKFKGRGYIYGVNSSKQQVEIPFVIR
ncbi:trypsin-like peptidase domain-containing protein [Ohtaekwangia sp.]|uniref:trypsin-like peptidase domain-containing protein n=1 Tax=Ohtaekwangia sp. TaxID=2066019 RepID=UPI002F95699B